MPGGDDAVSSLPEAQYIKHQDFPAAWRQRLREVSPLSDVHSWLEPHWHTGSQRWILYECVPIRYVHDNELIADLQGPDPESAEGQKAGITVSRFQQQMFRSHRVHARPCWVIQGEKGGHLYAFGESTKELCRARGLPTEPPVPGDKPYAPFDERVVVQIQRMSKLNRVRGDMGEFKRRFGSASSWKREKREELRRARAEFVKYLNDQLEVGDDLIQKAVALGETDDAPESDQEWVEEAEQQDARYIENGHF